MPDNINQKRRRYLILGATVVGVAGLAAASLPFIASMEPSSRARAKGAPVRVDISKLEPGSQITVGWRGRPVWILRRTEQNLRDLALPALHDQLRDPDSAVTSQQPAYIRDTARSIRPEYFVAVGLCTHLGCIPSYRPDRAPPDLGTDWVGGYFCPCHGSRFDLAGRVFKAVPAPINLLIPPYHYVSESVILIGLDPPHQEAQAT